MEPVATAEALVASRIALDCAKNVEAENEMGKERARWRKRNGKAFFAAPEKK